MSLEMRTDMQEFQDAPEVSIRRRDLEPHETEVGDGFIEVDPFRALRVTVESF
jgi:hypothetical protein